MQLEVCQISAGSWIQHNSRSVKDNEPFAREDQEIIEHQTGETWDLQLTNKNTNCVLYVCTVQNAPGNDSIPYDKFDCLGSTPYETVEVLEGKLWRITFSCEYRYVRCVSLLMFALQ